MEIWLSSARTGPACILVPTDARDPRVDATAPVYGVALVSATPVFTKVWITPLWDGQHEKVDMPGGLFHMSSKLPLAH